MKKNYSQSISIVARIIAIIFLLIAFFDQPSFYYKILRFVVFIISGYCTYNAVKVKQMVWIWMMFIIAILFNPIMPIYTNRGTWEFYDAIAILILSLSIPNMRISNVDNELFNKYRELKKLIVYGILLFFGAFLFWYHIAGNIFNELSLIKNATITNGYLTTTYEEETEDYRDRVSVSEIGVYIFHVPDGRKFHSKTSLSTEENIEIEYLPSDPSVNRAKEMDVRLLQNGFGKK